MTARQTVPPMRRKGPPDVLFSGAASEQPAAEPKHVKVAHYMPASMVADLDDLRAQLKRGGVNVDRSAVIRAAIMYASADTHVWIEHIEAEVES